MKRIAALMCLLASPAIAQQHNLDDPGHWYDLACCSEEDCQPIATEWVHVTNEGYYVTIPPGGHKMLDGADLWTSRVIEYSKVRRSQDQDYHACISKSNGGYLLCLYAPALGF